MNLPRIGIFTHKYYRTRDGRADARIHIYDFAHALAKYASVYVFAPDPGGEKETDTRVRVTWFPSGNTVGLFFKGRQAVIEFVQANKIDVCLAAWAIPSGYLAYHVKKILGIPYAIWALGSDIHTYARYPILRQLIATWLTHADLRFANSYFLREKVMRLTGKDCTFMPVVSDFPTQSRKIRLNLQKPFQFLYVGRLERIKGIDVLIHACTVLKEQGKEFRLDIVGDGSLRKQLERDVKEKGLDEEILFFGNQDKDRVIKHMMKADCLVIPSRKESFPQVLLEAARVGLPAIATDVGDCRRVLLKYRCGVLVENNTPASLAHAMSQCMKDRYHLQKLYGKPSTMGMVLGKGLQAFVKEFTAVRPEVILLQKLKTEVFTGDHKGVTLRV